MLLSAQEQWGVVISHGRPRNPDKSAGQGKYLNPARQPANQRPSFILFYCTTGIFNTSIIFGKLNQTYDFIGSCRTFLHLERYLFRPRIFRCIQCIQGRQRQLTFQHIITSRFADLLAIKVIENIILNLKTDTNIFAQQTGKSDFLLTHLH